MRFRRSGRPASAAVMRVTGAVMQARRPIENGSVFCRGLRKRKPEAAPVNATCAGSWTGFLSAVIGMSAGHAAEGFSAPDTLRWQTVYRYFRDWRRVGPGLVLMMRCTAISVILRVVRKAARSPGGFAIVDSRSVETGPDARERAGFDAGEKVKGRKRHIVADTPGMMLSVKVHGAGPQDRGGPALACERLVRRFPFIEEIRADGGYRGPIVQTSSPRPIEIVKRNQPGFEALPKRWIVERSLARIDRNRPRRPGTSRAQSPQPRPSSTPPRSCSSPADRRATHEFRVGL